jgi:hypothetical protein
VSARDVGGAATEPLPRWVRGSLWFGLVAVTVYVGGWAIAGQLRRGYDPRERAISELFELGAPWTSRGWLVAGLALSGVAFLALAPALHRALPGRGRLGPTLVALAGIGTLGVLAAPCTPGCPGFGTSTTDTWHVLTAGLGYVALATAPVAFAWRLRRCRPRVAGWSAIIGGVSTLLFVIHVAGVVPTATGLQQRTFNTVADAWYVLIVVHLLRHGPRAAGSNRGS